MNMTGNTILLTGGSSGIGRALAEAFHDLGNRVIVTGRRQALLDEIAAARPGLVGLPLDLDAPASLHELATEVRARYPQLNMLVANAGISRAEDMAADGWDASAASAAQALVQTNIMGVLQVVAAFLPMLKRQAHATVMATSSNLAFVPRADFPTYCASKAFLHSCRCVISCARCPSKCSSWHRRTSRPNSPASSRRATRARCLWPCMSPRSWHCSRKARMSGARYWSNATRPGAGPSETAATRPPLPP
jgi:hypothetical protein